MLNEKACAVALLNEISGDLIIENQYTKSDFIFYKFKDSNVAVSKRLNHVDFSILTEREWEFLLEKVNNEYIERNKEDIESSAEVYSTFISKWNEEESIISKVHILMNKKELLDLSIATAKDKLRENEKLMRLLLDNKAILNRHRGSEAEEIEVDVAINKQMTEDGRLKISVRVVPSNHTIDMLKGSILRDLGSAYESRSLLVNKVNVLLGFLIIRYNQNSNNPDFIDYRNLVYVLKDTDEISVGEQNNFIPVYKKRLLNVLSSSNTFMDMLYGHSYWNGYNIRNRLNGIIPDLDINYRDMTDEHILLFREYTTWLINRHAKYIGVNEKKRESYSLFLGGRQLNGKKATRIMLTEHLNLQAMHEEIERRVQATLNTEGENN